MAANPDIANPSLNPETEQTVSESGKPKQESLLERIEAALCKYFGEDEETILNWCKTRMKKRKARVSVKDQHGARSVRHGGFR